jgi:23S rRNA (cytosine1962-C5)-methyltransferase
MAGKNTIPFPEGLALAEATGWKDYALLDCGSEYKLERFGSLVLARPEPQAVWLPTWEGYEWRKKAQASFSRSKESPDKGAWTTASGVPERWEVVYNLRGTALRFSLQRTAFKHIGLFPEQAENWEWIYDAVQLLGNAPKVLNLFAYTGGASLAACAAGAEVTHVDAVRKVVDWGRQNQDASGLKGIRWVVEDAAAFVRREAKRGNRYGGIVLDPPAYGRGPDGEKWILEDHLDALLQDCAQILEPNGFVVLNLYSMGLSAVVAHTLLAQHFGRSASLVEHFATDAQGKRLPFGTVARIAPVP